MKMEDMLKIDGKRLVGKFVRRKVGISALGDWTMVNWDPLIGFNPSFYTLCKGWLKFIFKALEDAMKILGLMWFWDSSILIPKPWIPLFDPNVIGSKPNMA